MKVKNYWIYQARAAPEPWAAHVTVSNYGGLAKCDIVFYAEWIANDANRESWECAANYETFLATFERFVTDYGQLFAIDEIKQVNALWLQIARDFDI